MIERLINILTYNPKSPLIFSSGLFLYLFFGVALITFIIRAVDIISSCWRW